MILRLSLLSSYQVSTIYPLKLQLHIRKWFQSDVYEYNTRLTNCLTRNREGQLSSFCKMILIALISRNTFTDHWHLWQWQRCKVTYVEISLSNVGGHILCIGFDERNAKVSHFFRWLSNTLHSIGWKVIVHSIFLKNAHQSMSYLITLHVFYPNPRKLLWKTRMPIASFFLFYCVGG